MKLCHLRLIWTFGLHPLNDTSRQTLYITSSLIVVLFWVLSWFVTGFKFQCTVSESMACCSSSTFLPWFPIQSSPLSCGLPCVLFVSDEKKTIHLHPALRVPPWFMPKDLHGYVCSVTDITMEQYSCQAMCYSVWTCFKDHLWGWRGAHRSSTPSELIIWLPFI